MIRYIRRYFYTSTRIQGGGDDNKGFIVLVTDPLTRPNNECPWRRNIMLEFIIGQSAMTKDKSIWQASPKCNPEFQLFWFPRQSKLIANASQLLYLILICLRAAAAQKATAMNE